MKVFKSISALLIALLASFSIANATTAIQAGTYDSLYAGVFGGILPVEKLITKNSIGLGTFDGLDGEMVILNGTVYQVKGNGKVVIPPGTITSPFITAVAFYPTTAVNFSQKTTYEQMRKKIDSMTPEQNIPLAIRIHGTFSHIKTRSFHKQSEPYKRLPEIISNQPEFTQKEISGTLVGFRYPKLFEGINAVGYHFHFISDDKTFGGHALEFTVKTGTIETEKIESVQIKLPIKNRIFLETEFPLQHEK